MEAFAPRERWAEYLQLRRLGSEYDTPGSVEAARRSSQLQREFLAGLTDPERAEDWVVEGREEDSLAFVAVDGRLLAKAKFRPRGNMLFVLGRTLFDVCIRPAPGARSSRRFPGDPRHKQRIRERVEAWLVAEAERRAAPQTEAQWRLSAQAEFPDDAEFITAHLFRSVWRRLDDSCSIKLKGRPRA